MNLRRKRLGIGRYVGDELTIRALEQATGLDHRQWQHFIEQGWLSARKRARRQGAAPITYVTVDAVKALLKRHPEVLDYRSAKRDARVLLELDSLPDPPKYKRVVCCSEAWTDQVKPTPGGRKVTHGAAELRPSLHRFKMRSCAAEGGTPFWAPLYSSPTCPRCGCTVSRYAPEGVFSDVEPGDEEMLDMLARKLGLRWQDGALRDADGREITDGNVLFYLFGSERNPGRAVGVFQKLIEAGLQVDHSIPIEATALRDNILRIELRPEQEAALQAFARTGSMTAAHAMSFGKSTLALAVMTRLQGRHLLMVNTNLLREQWIEKLRHLAPRVDVRRVWKPAHVKVTVYTATGEERCTIEIYSYLTRAKLDDAFVVAAWDEAHHLPSRHAHRHAFVKCKYRLGLTATPMREDNRDVLIHKMTGQIVGEDWTGQMASGQVTRVPVKVLIVEDREHKNEIVAELVEGFRVAVYTEAIQDGKDIALRCGIPFVHGATKNKLEIVRAARCVCFSRVGDCGLSMPECQITIDHSGLFGSRAQSVQRLGRLMHSSAALYHLVLMTAEERRRFGKRIDAIRAKGFDVSEDAAPRRSRAQWAHRLPHVQGRVSAQENPYLALMGWRTSDLMPAV